MSDNTEDNTETERGRSWRSRAVDEAVAIAWAVNIAVVIGGFAWVYFDGRSLHTIELIRAEFLQAQSDPSLLVRGASWSDGSALAVKAGAVLSACTLLGMFAGLFVAGPPMRSLRAWLMFSAVVCGWLGLFAAWPEIYWRGQQRRLAPDLTTVASFARELSANWPKEDGDWPGVGPFLAYPRGRPATMMMLTTTTIPGTDLYFSGVERSVDGALRFELSGTELGAWLEWRPDRTPPQRFVGGLETNYRLLRHSQLAPEWFLVRYLATGID